MKSAGNVSVRLKVCQGEWGGTERYTSQVYNRAGRLLYELAGYVLRLHMSKDSLDASTSFAQTSADINPADATEVQSLVRGMYAAIDRAIWQGHYAACILTTSARLGVAEHVLHHFAEKGYTVGRVTHIATNASDVAILYCLEVSWRNPLLAKGAWDIAKKAEQG